MLITSASIGVIAFLSILAAALRHCSKFLLNLFSQGALRSIIAKAVSTSVVAFLIFPLEVYCTRCWLELLFVMTFVIFEACTELRSLH